MNATTGLPATGPGVSGAPAGGTIASGGNGTNTSRGDSSNGNLSGRAVLQFTPSEDVMLYGSYTRGYKGPAFNVFFNHTAPTNAIPIDEETSDAFEIGLKSQFLDNRVQFNLSAFTVTYDGFQANNFVLLNGAVVSNLTNAGSVKSEGFEVDLLAVPVDGWTLRASGAYADATVKRFNPNPATNAPDARNGTQLPLAPKFTWTIGTSYERDLGGFKMYLDTDFRHVSRQFSDLGEQGPIAAYGIWNGSIGFSDPEDNYRVSFLARNITDKAYALLNVSAASACRSRAMRTAISASACAPACADRSASETKKGLGRKSGAFLRAAHGRALRTAGRRSPLSRALRDEMLPVWTDSLNMLRGWPFPSNA